MAKKTWNQKLHSNNNMPRVEILDCMWAARLGPRMLMVPALDYNMIMGKVLRGKVITTEQMRAHFAQKHNADWTCGLTAGIFVNTCAHAAIERGDKDFPYWRTLKKQGELCEKFPDGIDGHKLLLEMEGHKVIQKGKRYFVENYEEKLHKID